MKAIFRNKSCRILFVFPSVRIGTRGFTIFLECVVELDVETVVNIGKYLTRTGPVVKECFLPSTAD